jgi:hypothetical protein
LLYPKYSSSNPIGIWNSTNRTIETKHTVIYEEEKQTKFIDIEKVPPKNKDTIKLDRINESNGKSSNNDIPKKRAAIDNNTFIENSTKNNTKNNTILYYLLKYKQKDHRNKNCINLHVIRDRYESKYITEKSVYSKTLRNIGYSNVDITISSYSDYMIKCNKRKCINMNIKHLKIFISTNNMNNTNINKNSLHLYVYLDKQLKIKYNLNININFIDINKAHKINKHNWNHMPNFEELTELYIRLPIDLYNSIDIKILDVIFNDNGWHRLEQLLNILCITANGNLNGFDNVWWNMQTCWTLFNKNPEAKKIKPTINCEAITDDDEEEIMIVYTIIEENVPINIDTRSFQEITVLIAAI